jgi:hypothetical protein
MDFLMFWTCQFEQTPTSVQVYQPALANDERFHKLANAYRYQTYHRHGNCFWTSFKMHWFLCRVHGVVLLPCLLQSIHHPAMTYSLHCSHLVAVSRAQHSVAALLAAALTAVESA